MLHTLPEENWAPRAQGLSRGPWGAGTRVGAPPTCKRRSAPLTVKSDVSMLPRVGPFSTMKLRSPVRMVDTDQAGFHVSGWKSVMERHSLVLHLNLPLGVII